MVQFPVRSNRKGERKIVAFENVMLIMDVRDVAFSFLKKSVELCWTVKNLCLTLSCHPIKQAELPFST